MELIVNCDTQLKVRALLPEACNRNDAITSFGEIIAGVGEVCHCMPLNYLEQEISFVWFAIIITTNCLLVYYTITSIDID